MVSQLKREISAILQEEVSDPRIGFVSITDITLTPDLQFANVYVSLFGETQAKQKSLAGLAAATPFIRHTLANRLNLRMTPELRFVQDDSLERGSRVLEKMKALQTEGKQQEEDV